MRRTLWSTVLPTVLVAATTLLVACGVPIDRAPRAITRTTVAPPAETPTTIASTGAPEVGVYFLRDDRLVRQGYPVDGEPTVAQAVTFVLAGPPDGTEDLTSAIPPGTELRGVEVTDGVATIDLTSAVDDVRGPTQKQAFAQVAFTALDFESVKAVRFLVDGGAIDAPTDEGNVALVTADDFDKPLNPR